MREGPHAVHGMGRDLAEPDWLPLTDDELLAILGRSDPGGLGRRPVVTWRSPRPMSAAALVRHGDAMVFVKRHHVSVRIPEQLAAEHDFATHLRAGGLPVPAVVRLADGQGQSVLRRGDFCYEVHQVAGGLDLYRDAVSWSPYASLGHAYASGAALARLHLAATDFGRPARPFATLMNSCQVITAPDPLDAADRLVAARPALAAYLAGRRWQEDFEEVLVPLIGRAAPRLAELRPAVGARRLAPVQPHLDLGRARRAGGGDLRLRAGQPDLRRARPGPGARTRRGELARPAGNRHGHRRPRRRGGPPGRLPDRPASDRSRSRRAPAAAAGRARRVRAVRGGLLHQRAGLAGDGPGKRRPGLRVPDRARPLVRPAAGRGPAPIPDRLLCSFTGRRRPGGRPGRARRRSAAPG